MGGMQSSLYAWLNFELYMCSVVKTGPLSFTLRFLGSTQEIKLMTETEEERKQWTRAIDAQIEPSRGLS